MSAAEKFFELVRHPFKFRLFLLTKLPSAFFSGVRVKYVDEQKCVVVVPYKWFSTNPFRSTYFACLSMAAEMSTGVLAMAHTYRRMPAISMLVMRVEGSFHKKATTTTSFACTDGDVVKRSVDEAMASGKATTVTMRAVGTNPGGELVAEFSITWSFKVKSK